MCAIRSSSHNPLYGKPTRFQIPALDSGACGQLCFKNMCGRFARRSTQEVLADWFGVELEDMPWFAPSYNVAPQSVQPVLRINRDSGQREFAQMRWGLVPFWAKDAKFGYTTINARAEEVASKPAYREALKKRRCLVPADAFYEWQTNRQENEISLRICSEEWRTLRHGRIVGALAAEGRRSAGNFHNPHHRPQ